MIKIDSTRRTGLVNHPEKAGTSLPASPIAPRSFTRSMDVDKLGASTIHKPAALNGLSPALRALAQEQPEMRPMVNAAGAVVAVLAGQKVFAEVGGSLAARAYGGIRDPGDINIQVGNTTDFDRAFRTLADLSTVVRLPDGGRARIQGAPRNLIPGISGLVDLNFSHQDGHEETFLVDLLQENSPAAFTNLNSPNYTGRLASPSNATVPHLIAGYISRYLDRPDISESQQDLEQIAAMIRKTGTDLKNPVACANMSRVICAKFTPETRSKAEAQMKEILEWMKAGDL